MTSSFQPWHMMEAKLVQVIAEIPGVATYDFELADTATPYQFAPGQFNMVYVPGVGEAAISLSGMTGTVLHHTIREAGNVTHDIARCPPGSTLGIRGPFGSSWPMAACTGKDIILAAGGIGLAPVRPVVYEVLNHPEMYGKLTVLHGARTPSGLLYAREYEDWRQAGVAVSTIVDHADTTWLGQVGVITQLLNRCTIQRPTDTILMTCGPEIMMHFVAKTALARGIPAQQIYVSLERHMNCAIGLCGHCQLGPTFVCKDGPVYRYDQILPFMKVEGL
jgi:NAD(P)H-flavin reductase